MTAPYSPAQRREWIAMTLHEARLNYSWAPGDAVVAALTLRLPHRPALNLSLRHDGTVLQLVAHGALADDYQAQMLADRDVLSQEWAVGRAYHVPGTGAWDLSASLYSPGRAAPAEALLALLATMSDAPDLLARGRAPLLLVEPAQTPAAMMPGVAAALAAAGLQPHTAHAGEMHSVLLQMDRLRVRVDCFLTGGTVLVARAQPLGVAKIQATPLVLQSLNALNGRLDIGGVGLAYDAGLALGWIAHPAAWFEPRADAWRWTCERAASWCEAAHLAALAVA